ncbi:hypothetical protein ACSQ67_017001 [Phaseolus vulgaris]
MKSVCACVVPLAVVLVLTVAAMKPVNGFNCPEAKRSLLPCVPFLTTNADKPSPGCCHAVVDVKASAPTKPELRAACDCVVEGARGIPNLDKDKAIQLPIICIIDLGFPITKDFHCTM